jgi:serine protease Do
MKYFIIPIVICAFLSCATSSGYYKYYQEHFDTKTNPDVVRLKENEDPKIFTSKNIHQDAVSVESNHYLVVGVSSFNGVLANYDGIKEICKKSGATLVLVSANLTDSKTESGNLTLPQTQTSTINGSIYGNGGNSFYNGTVTTQGTTNIPYSYTIDKYDQIAVFFIQTNKKFLIGISSGEINSEIQKSVKRNTGIYVRVVYKNTPAFFANIIPGDIITKCNGVDVISYEQSSQLFSKLKSGDIINLEILRDSKIENINVQL